MFVAERMGSVINRGPRGEQGEHGHADGLLAAPLQGHREPARGQRCEGHGGEGQETGGGGAGTGKYC